MNKIFLRDAGIINEKTNKKYFNKKEFFLRLENALFLCKKKSIGLQLTINQDFFMKYYDFFLKKKKDFMSLKKLTVHLHAYYDSLISESKKTQRFVKLLNTFFKDLNNLDGYCIHPDNVSNYFFLKKLKTKKRYVAIEVCDLKSKSGNNVGEIRDLLKKNKFLTLVLDSSHINQIKEKYKEEYDISQYFYEFKKKIVEFQISSNKNNYQKKIFTRNFKTDHCLLALSNKKIYNELKRLKGLKNINLVIEGVVPNNNFGHLLLNKEIRLLNNFKL
tara:strand:+ start:1356 stop:2177 length:822 start_codon:yes stop_codon:yes gene_type:complete